MEKQKILYIRQYNIGQEIFQNVYDEVHIYPYTSKWEGKIRRFCLSLGMGKNWLENSFREVDLNCYDLVVVSELFSYDPVAVIQYIREHNSHCHILYWMRNTWFAEKYGTGITEKNIQQFLEQQKVLNFKIISFDKGDCRKYDLLYVPPTIIKDALYALQKIGDSYSIKWDLFWYGKDKNRIRKILSVKRYCDEHELTYSMNTLRVKKKHYTDEEKQVLAKKDFPYKEYLEMILRSRATLDILQKGQEGIGARPVETLLLKRKLITDYAGIQEYDFYRKENIFILGKDDFRRLPDFLTSPYQEVPEEIVSRYTFEGMLQNVYKTLGWEWKEPDRKS